MTLYPSLLCLLASVIRWLSQVDSSINLALVSGELYLWGCNRYNQLDPFGKIHAPKAARSIRSPLKISFDCLKAVNDRIVSCSAGAHHSAILTEKGRVAVWGDPRFGVLGPLCDHSKEKSSITWFGPADFDGKRVVSLSSGWSHLAALTECGDIFTWGRGHLGCLGHLDPTCPDFCSSLTEQAKPQVTTQVNPHLIATHPRQILFPHRTGDDHCLPLPVPQIPSTSCHQLACGSEHCLALDTTGCLWAWGWNEHGMCGNSDRKEGQQTSSGAFPNNCIWHPVPVSFCEVSSPSDVEDKKFFLPLGLVSAGYGHSFATVRA
ncbi:unnamed protein product [Protopolystoma xenopodis]|uniref:Uncharacterized protein n=1 Tax=Protopolystoma xenopodis TaxID=117903 RepID=A0A448X131_9PLAT|nr:unnamed protein product [Protopolystoma xenopodis]